MDAIINYLSDSNKLIELFGTGAGIVYLIFSIRRIIYLWHLGFLTSLLYTWVFFTSKFYADMGLQVYYLVISVYGWYNWKYGNVNNSNEALPIQSMSMKLFAKLSLATLVMWPAIAWVLIRFTDSPLPWWDSFTTAASITATWMLARKILENWLFWIVIDAISCGLYIYKDLHFTTLLFVVYTIMAVVGYLDWRKALKRTKKQERTYAYCDNRT